MFLSFCYTSKMLMHVHDCCRLIIVFWICWSFLIYVTYSWEAGMGDVMSDNILTEYYIPDYILVPGSEPKKPLWMPSCPVLVFINSKSGGQLGGDLLLTYSSVLNKNQVFVLFIYLCLLLEDNAILTMSIHLHNQLVLGWLILRFLIWGRRNLIRCYTKFMPLWGHLNSMGMFWLQLFRIAWE